MGTRRLTNTMNNHDRSTLNAVIGGVIRGIGSTIRVINQTRILMTKSIRGVTRILINQT